MIIATAVKRQLHIDSAARSINGRMKKILFSPNTSFHPHLSQMMTIAEDKCLHASSSKKGVHHVQETEP
jgi:hypothetical protein